LHCESFDETAVYGDDPQGAGLHWGALTDTQKQMWIDKALAVEEKQ
jgi:hypothetical protein